MRGFPRAWRTASCGAALATCLLTAAPVAAQGLGQPADPPAILPPPITLDARPADGDLRRPIFRETVTRVLKDPTTYALPPIVYTAHRLDWDSSQKLFAYGYLEANPDFTLSGRADDAPISYHAGNRKILRFAAGTLGRSVLNNAACAIVERRLIDRYPHRRKLIRALGWIERSLVTSYWTYRLTHNQVRQWQDNERTLDMLRARSAAQ
jgi:hypothetical protein